MAVELSLRHGVCRLDDEDWERLSRYGWCSKASGHMAYAVADISGRQEYMHRMVLGALPGQRIDHADRDGLNNQRSNLRFATRSQNAANRPGYSNRLLPKGVYPSNPPGRYVAHIMVDQKMSHLGTFSTPQEAADAYAVAARSAWGEFAYTGTYGR